MNGKIPHALRIVIFFLRLALGLNFLYLGISALFDATVAKNLHGQSFTGLYAWLSGQAAASPWHVYFAWAFLIVGGCLILGLATRFAAVLGVILVVMGYLPVFSTATALYDLANVDVITMLCLLIILFSNAGAYIGFDMFIHVHLPNKQKR
jgi:uncharacterized membrane protein YphA (DoxX/SURF4 family)